MSIKVAWAVDLLYNTQRVVGSLVLITRPTVSTASDLWTTQARRTSHQHNVCEVRRQQIPTNRSNGVWALKIAPLRLSSHTPSTLIFFSAVSLGRQTELDEKAQRRELRAVETMMDLAIIYDPQLIISTLKLGHLLKPPSQRWRTYMRIASLKVLCIQ